MRSIKEECLDRMIPIGARHFRRAVAEYVEHYHQERNHQGLDNRLIAGTPVIDMTIGCSAGRGRVGCSISTSGPPDGLGRILEQYGRASREKGCRRVASFPPPTCISRCYTCLFEDSRLQTGALSALSREGVADEGPGRERAFRLAPERP